MALNFPTSPSTGDVHQASNSLSYFFDGVKWITQGTYDTGTINAIKLDSLTSSFNGSLTTFNLTSNNVAVKPANAQSIQISLGNVIQEPVTAYTINSVQGTITFASAPASNTAFFGIVFSRLPIETTVTNVSDGVITDIKVASNAAIAQSKLNISDATTSASGFMSSTDKTKLNGIESNATADQTNEEIQDIVGAMVSGNTESGITVTYQDSDGTLDFSVASQTDNNFTNADHTKLDGIEASATADQTAAEIRSLVESASDSNVFTDADHTKLNGIEASATADQTASEIVALLSGQNITTGVIESTIDSANNTLKIETTTSGDPKVSFNAAGSGGHDIEYIRSSNTLNFKQGGGSVRMSIAADGTVNIVGNLDVGAGIDVTGEITATSHIDLPDNAILKLGTSDDLQIYHDGSHSHLVSNTGNLRILADGAGELVLTSKAGEEAIVCAQDGSVEIMHDNSKKLETVSGGINITGSVTDDGANHDGDVNFYGVSSYNAQWDKSDASFKLLDNAKLKIGTGADLQIYHSGSHSFIQDEGTGNLYIDANQLYLRNADTDNVLLQTTSAGVVQIKHNGTTKIETTSVGVTVTGNVIASGTLTGVSTSSVPALTAKGDGSSQDGYIQLNCSQNSHGVKIKAPPHSAAASYTLTLPDTDGSANQVLKTDGNGNLSWVNQSSGGGGSSIGGDTGVDFNDNIKARFGTGNDLEIYHNGTDTYIDNTNGELFIKTTTKFNLRSDGNEAMIVATPNGAVELKYDNSTKLQTTSSGVTVFGDASTGTIIQGAFSLRDTSSSSDRIKWIPNSPYVLRWADNFKASFGFGDDLQIYHSGSHSFIKDSGTGNLQIWTNQLSLLNAAGGESMIQAVENGQVELYYDNSKKLETYSNGIKAFNHCRVEGAAGESAVLALYADGNQAGTDQYLMVSGTDHTLKILGTFDSGWHRYMQIDANGGVSLYHDAMDSGSPSAKFATTADGISTQGTILHRGAEGGTAQIRIEADEGDDNADKWRFIANTDGSFELQNYASGSYETNIYASGNGSVNLYYDNSKKFETTTTGVKTLGDVSFRTSGNTQTILYDESDGQLEFVDSIKAVFGSSSDLKIYHTGGGHSFVEAIGQLRLCGTTNVVTRTSAFGDVMINAIADGAVELYYDNNKKLETTNVGISITGNIDLTAELNLTGGSDAQRYIDAAVGTSALTFRGCTSGDANHQEMARFFRGGGCELNHAGTKKLETASGGVTITGLLTATASNLETGEFGMTTASGTPQSRFMDFGFLNNSLNMRRTNGGEDGHTNFLTVASSLIVSGDLNDTSDEKLKKNIASIADGAIAIIKQLRPVTFDWIDENRNNNVSGFIAQEVKTVLPNLVYGTEYDSTLVDETKGSKGGIKSEGYSVNTVGITAHLTKALQEAIAKIEILETKVATLEAA